MHSPRLPRQHQAGMHAFTNACPYGGLQWTIPTSLELCCVILIARPSPVPSMPCGVLNPRGCLTIALW